LLVSNGHPLDDVKNRYTIDQVYLFFEKCKKMMLEQDRMNAIVTARSMMYSSPYVDKKDRERSWKEFMDSLNWDNLHKAAKEKKKGTAILTNFKALGIPIMGMPKGGAK